MEIIKNIDPLLEKQPEKRFAELLSTPVHAEKPVDFGKRKKRKNETAFYSIKTEFDFPDIEGNLEYAYKDFDAFLSCIEIEKRKTENFST